MTDDRYLRFKARFGMSSEEQFKWGTVEENRRIFGSGWESLSFSMVKCSYSYGGLFQG